MPEPTPPSTPSGGLYGDKLLCTVVAGMETRPRLAVTLPVLLRPATTPIRPSREMELNGGALSVFRYGHNDRLDLVAPTNYIPAWAHAILKAMEEANTEVSILTMQSGRTLASMPLRWKVGGDPGSMSTLAADITTELFSMQYDTATGVNLKSITTEDDTLPFLTYPPELDEYKRFVFDRAALLYAGGGNEVANNNFLTETAHVPEDWTVTGASVAGTTYGVQETVSHLNSRANVLWLSKPSIDAADYYWESRAFTVTPGEDLAVFCGVQTFGCGARVEVAYDSGSPTGEFLNDTYKAQAYQGSFTVPGGASTGTLRLYLPSTSTTGEVWFSCPQVLRDRTHTTVVGLNLASSSRTETWDGTVLCYDLPTPFHPTHNGYAVAFCYVQPGWGYGDLEAAEEKVVLHFTNSDHGSDSLRVLLTSGVGGPTLELWTNGSLRDSDIITNYSAGDTLMVMVSYAEDAVAAHTINLSDTDTLFTAGSTTVAHIPDQPLTRVYPGCDASGNQLDGLLGGLHLMTHETGSGETLSDMRDYLVNSHVLDIARMTLGRRYDLTLQADPYIKEGVWTGALLLTETEKF